MNYIGHLFKLHLYGESHSPEIKIVIEGCPAGIKITPDCFVEDLTRRACGSKGTSMRLEKDIPHFCSGITNNISTGKDITISFRNENIKSEDYDFDGFFRPGHADFTSYKKYKGSKSLKGGGQFSGRMTVALVAAGVIAKKIISPIDISAEIIEIGGQKSYTDILDKAIKDKDSLGGIIRCNIRNVQVGLGEPFFYSIESAISSAIFSIPGIKAIEFGEGIKAAKIRGSEYNDVFIDETGKTTTNNSGGINGGISNSNDIFFRVFVRPTSSIGKTQHTLNFKTGKMGDFTLSGRHDNCFVLRINPVIEAMTAIAMADLMFIANS